MSVSVSVGRVVFGIGGGVRGGVSRMRIRVRDGYRGIGASVGVVLWGLWDMYELWISIYVWCVSFGFEF